MREKIQSHKEKLKMNEAEMQKESMVCLFFLLKYLLTLVRISFKNTEYLVENSSYLIFNDEYLAFPYLYE